MFKNEKFSFVKYYEHGGKGSATGESADNAAAMVDGNVMSIEAGMVIEKCYVIVDTAVTGVTALNIGDDDGSTSFVPTASITLATPGMYGWDAKAAGAYLRIQTAGATDAGDIYVVPSAKYYSVGTKSVKADFTTASTAGKLRVVVQGFKHVL